eukprot:3244467-Pyramimonas_sp.AAC.1
MVPDFPLTLLLLFLLLVLLLVLLGLLLRLLLLLPFFLLLLLVALLPLMATIGPYWLRRRLLPRARLRSSGGTKTALGGKDEF